MLSLLGQGKKSSEEANTKIKNFSFVPSFLPYLAADGPPGTDHYAGQFQKACFLSLNLRTIKFLLITVFDVAYSCRC